MALAASGVSQTSPGGTATPYWAKKLFGLVFVNVHLGKVESLMFKFENLL